MLSVGRGFKSRPFEETKCECVDGILGVFFYMLDLEQGNQ